MTENIDDRLDRLVRALSKPNLYEMMVIWDNHQTDLDVNDMVNHSWAGKRELFFNNYNWTWLEFFEQRKNYLNRE